MGGRFWRQAACALAMALALYGLWSLGVLNALAARLELLSPLQTLERGYAVVSREGRIVRDAAELRPGQRLDIRLARGRAEAIVEKAEEE